MIITRALSVTTALIVTAVLFAIGTAHATHAGNAATAVLF